HRPSGDGIDIRPMPSGVVATIPRGAMLPQGSTALIVAGRAASGDQEANSAYRVQATCMAMGQAAGVMAALSVKMGLDPEEIPMRDIYKILKEHGAILPGETKELFT
ncbi:MAG: FAD-dependent oxidoreductase, partial [Spirochaetia bacterium]|nr:FAD-dependent oxidoreductase [Spirochaetia bacterium]